MAEATIRGGFDTFAGSANPTVTRGSAKYLQIASGAQYAYLYLRNPAPRGATVISATLTVKARAASSGARVLTVRRVGDSWKASKLNWNNKPGVVGVARTASIGTVADGDPIAFDVTTHLQTATNGSPHYGWRIETDSSTSHKLYGLDAGSNKPVLTVVYSFKPGVPTDITPNGVISVAKPVCQASYADLTGEDLVAVQVQIDPAGNASSPAFDSGQVSATEPELDLTQSFARTASVTTTSASTTITAAAATFETADIGATITGTGIPAGATITAVASGTSATISAAATASGTVTATITRTYPGLADGAATKQRWRVKDAGGVWSNWSDWVDFSRTTKDSVTLSNPDVAPNNFVTEPTPPIIASLPVRTLAAYQVRITAGDDQTDIRYDSEKIRQAGGSISHTIPFRSEEVRRVLRDDSTYQVNVRTWDNIPGRVATPGDPAFSSVWRTFTVNYDATVTAPNTLTATQEGASPWVVLGFQRATAPDSFLIRRRTNAGPWQVVEAGIDPADILVTAGVYEYRDVTADPKKTHDYVVRAVVNGKQSPDSNTASITVYPRGIWVIDYDRDLSFVVGGKNVDSWEYTDQAATYEIIGGGAVTITTGMSGLAGTFDGPMRDRTDDDTNRTLNSLVADLWKIKERPDDTYRLVAGDLSIPVKITDLSCAPHRDSTRDHPLKRVSFRFHQHGGLPFTARL